MKNKGNKNINKREKFELFFFYSIHMFSYTNPFFSLQYIDITLQATI